MGTYGQIERMEPEVERIEAEPRRASASADLSRRLTQLISVIRMSDLDQSLGPFPMGSPGELGHSPLRDDVVGPIPRQGHESSFLEVGHDVRCGPVSIGRGKHGHRPPPSGEKGADVKLDLAARAVDEPWTKLGFAGDLPGQIDLDGVVDRHLVLVSGDVCDVDDVLPG